MDYDLELVCATCGEPHAIVPKNTLPSDPVTCNSCGAVEPYFDLCAHRLEHTIQSIQDRLYEIVAKAGIRQKR